MSDEFNSRVKRSRTYPPSKSFSNAIAVDETLAAKPPGRARSLFLKFKNVANPFSRFTRSRSRDPGQNVNHTGNIKVQKIAVKEGVDPKSVTVQNTSPDAKEVTVPIAVVHNTPADVKKSDVPPGPLAVVGSQDPPSRAEARAELQAVGVVGVEVQAAREAADNINPLGGRVEKVMLTAKDGPANLDTTDNFSDTYLKPLKIFNSMIDTIANVHPYAKIALGALSCASKIVLAQVDRDKALLGLVIKVAQVYDFICQDETLGQISSMGDIISQISQQILECAYFIRDYSMTENFWPRLKNHIFSDTDSTIQKYIESLDAFMEDFRNQTLRDVAIFVHHTGDELNLIGMTYAVGAGLDTAKQCIPGTRKNFISQIMNWIDKSGDSAGRVLWLSGTAGTGKTAIAHTIAGSFIGARGLCSCYCFDRHQKGDLRHQKIFSTIARDLADRHPQMRRALASAVQNNTALKNTADIVQQWDKLLMKPLASLSESVGRVVIVIDALDESGGVDIRSNLLRILSGNLQGGFEIPNNVRFIVTSRPLRDIDTEFAGAQHIQRMSMDEIPPETAKQDIRTYVSKKLDGLPDFGETEFGVLAEKADGLFEWARLACDIIKVPPTGVSSKDSFEAVASCDPTERKHLLYKMYHLFLTGIMPKDKYNPATRHKQLTKFRSVMRQILGTKEPLPIESLNAMRAHFPNPEEHYKVDDIVKQMGSLLSGTTNSSTPVRPLHATFCDFLTHKSCDKDFFVDTSEVQNYLSFASLRVMKKLSFNICDFKTSYIPNCSDIGLQERVKKKHPPALVLCLSVLG